MQMYICISRCIYMYPLLPQTVGALPRLSWTAMLTPCASRPADAGRSSPQIKGLHVVNGIASTARWSSAPARPHQSPQK